MEQEVVLCACVELGAGARVEIESVDFNGRDWIAFDALGGPLGVAGQPFTTGGEVRLRGLSGSYLLQVSGFTGKITVERIDE